MKKPLWNVFKLSPLVVAASFLAANSAVAAEVKAEVQEETTSVSQLSQESNSMGQVTSVSQFSDVQPTDWAFQALQSLVERYGCIAGYPNGTYRGNRAMTRYEFAAGLNACLDRVNELIATATADLVTKEDLATLQRLQEEFSAELATLRGRVDALEARTAELEANQFSTTTKLVGEAIFAVSDVFGDNGAISASTLRRNPNTPDRDLDANTTFSDRIRLSLLSSFTGKDQLQVRLQAGNVFSNNNTASLGEASTGTNMTRLAFDGFNNNQNSVTIDKINYAFNLSDAIRVKVDANTGEFWENINNFNPVFSSSGKGAISRYGRFSPIYRQGQGGSGATISFNPNGALSASVGYLAGGRNNVSNNPLDKQGLLDGNYAALAQIAFQPTKAFNVGLTYARTYQNSAGGVSLFESTGSDIANQPFGNNIATSANHYGVEATFKPSDKFILAGWYGYTDAEAQNSSANRATSINGIPLTVARGDNASFNYWGASLALQDFGRKGNLLGFIFGQSPRTASNDARIAGGRGLRDTDTAYSLEGLYRIQLNDNISIAPALLVIFNPEHNDRNDNIYVGTLRTTFAF
ncbi:carbohydrate-selective porin OprB [Tolypothrix sp. NIES-4075]|uniref:iron uptake porin n=1 Tax=Tolypothrix sp. NIES-4075 TaxID=2005459 RepID=UPI000B5C766A|nr:iron uptake porin [Tolypothrix sp. NIES-4075]GAX40343.1 carbohydrate-selective porin OprB [Tolypothrix sp. NIES-4075]